MSSGEKSRDRNPPRNLEAEKYALGSMMLDAGAVTACIELLKGVKFYWTSHHLIFNAVKELFNENIPVEWGTVAEQLRKTGKLDDVGGIEYLMSLTESVVTPSNVDFYAKIVKESYFLRTMISVCSDIINDSYEYSEDAQKVLDRAEQKVFEIRQQTTTQGFRPLADGIENSLELIEKLSEKDGAVSGLSTGIAALDSSLSGMHRGNLIIIAARPSMGKTSLGLNVAHFVGLVKNVPVGVFSLEMSRDDLLLRMLCTEAQVNMKRVRDGFIGSKDWAALTTAAGRLKSSKIFIDDTPNMNTLEMKARARRLKAENPGLGLIVVDYLQLMSAPEGRKSEGRQQEISEISRSLKIMAKELDLPVIAMSQLNRSVEKRGGDMRPRLSDLRESGAIEQDADVVLFIHRPSYYKNPAEITEDDNVSELIIGKQRNGPTGTVKVVFIEEYTKFREYTSKHEF